MRRSCQIAGKISILNRPSEVPLSVNVVKGQKVLVVAFEGLKVLGLFSCNHHHLLQGETDVF